MRSVHQNANQYGHYFLLSKAVKRTVVPRYYTMAQKLIDNGIPGPITMYRCTVQQIVQMIYKNNSLTRFL